MNQRFYYEMEIEKNGRNYRCSLPIGSPFAEAHEVLLEMAQQVVTMSKEQEELARQNAAKESEPVTIANQ